MEIFALFEKHPSISAVTTNTKTYLISKPHTCNNIGRPEHVVQTLKPSSLYRKCLLCLRVEQRNRIVKFDKYANPRPVCIMRETKFFASCTEHYWECLFKMQGPNPHLYLAIHTSRSHICTAAINGNSRNTAAMTKQFYKRGG